MKILVTGATGFVGQHITDYLLSQGHEVVALVTDRQRALEYSWHKKVTIVEYKIELNVIDEDLFALFGCPELMIHSAWSKVSDPTHVNHIRYYLHEHFLFIANLIENGLRRLTVVGTCFEYGMKNGLLNETLPTAPTTPYGLAKDSLRKLLEVMQNEWPFALTWLRLFYLHGQGQHNDSLFSQLERSIQKKETVFNMSGGEQLRDYLPVKEAASIICQLALSDSTTGVINCCSGIPISVRRVVEDYIHKRNSQLSLNLGYYTYRPFEPMAFWGSVDKLKKFLSNE